MRSRVVLRGVSVWAMLTLLSACGGGEGSSAASQSCEYLGGGSARASFDGSACTPCSANNPEAALDQDTNSFAQLNYATGIARLSGTAQSGVIFSEGPRNPGALIGLPTGNARTFVLTFRTYLAGTLQEEDSVVAEVNSLGNGPAYYKDYYAISTQEQFDAIEVDINRGVNGSTSQPVLVYEFCARRG